MKNILFLILLMVTGSVSAQDTLFVTQKKFLTVHFPKEISMVQTNALTDKSIGVNTTGNTMFIQNFYPIEATNIVVKTIDDKFYPFIIIEKGDIKTLVKTVKPSEEEIKIQQKIEQKQQIAKEEEDKVNHDIYEKILASKGYIRTRNYIESNRISALLKGTYYKDQKLYLYFELNNKTKIDYIIERLNFFIVNKKGITKSGEKIQIEVLDTFSPSGDTTNLMGKKEVIFVIEKFSLADDKKMLLEVIESQGERNLKFNILPQIINQSKTI
ncbi:DUF4138 domain-containing protein [Myroides odoratimimus]|uniref:DUF4138 domain-containing protein n=1 Tax=Myroides odoratimimus TaxID=76832 RepID=UPI002578F0DB|nr:DUF4138 domain-containing protein [Myroides odoratimimus]MDM1398867.1 DUF4138 domain-containing protein [Myroides odoratimimus]